MDKKINAFYKGKPVDVFEAKSLQRNKKLPRDSQHPVFFDLPIPEIALPAYPRETKNSLPVFVYFKGLNSQEIERNNEHMKGADMTLAHRVFTKSYSNFKHFTITTKTNGWDKVEIELFVESATIEKYVKDTESGKYYFIDVLLNLYGTKPYSFYYQWNGKLALEIKVTHEVDSEKIKAFSKMGIQIAEINISKSTKDKLENLKSSITTELKFNELVESYSWKTRDGIYKPYIWLHGNINICPEFKMRFEMLRNYEEQLEDLKNQKESLIADNIKLNERNINELNDYDSRIKKKRLEFLNETERNKKERIEHVYTSKLNELRTLEQITAERDELNQKLSDIQF